MFAPLRLAAILLTCIACLAQDPQQDTDKQLVASLSKKLTSETAGEVAWGGFLAHRYRLKDLAPPLLTAMKRWRNKEGLDARVVRLHLLDGLIGSGAGVPSEAIEFLLADALTRQGAFALLARQPRRNQRAIIDAAMAPAPSSDPVRKHAAQVIVDFHLLATAYTEFLLEHLECRLAIEVVDDKTSHGPWRSAVGFPRNIPVGLERLDGFPPLIRLDLGTNHHADEITCIAVPMFGGTPLRVSRQQGVTYEPKDLKPGKPEPAPDQQQIASTLSRMAHMELDRVTFHRLKWQDAEAYRQQVQQHHQAMRDHLDTFSRKLQKRLWLRPRTPESYRIPIHVEIKDKRATKSPALPDFSTTTSKKAPR